MWPTEAGSSLGGLKDRRIGWKTGQTEAVRGQVPISNGNNAGHQPRQVSSPRKQEKPPMGPDLSALVATLPSSSSQGLSEVICAPCLQRPQPSRPCLSLLSIGLPPALSQVRLPLFPALDLRGWEPSGSECPSQQGASDPGQPACTGPHSPQSGPGCGCHSCWPTSGGPGAGETYSGRWWPSCHCRRTGSPCHF